MDCNRPRRWLSDAEARGVAIEATRERRVANEMSPTRLRSMTHTASMTTIAAPEPAQLLTVPEVARMLSVAPSTLYRRIESGELKAIRLGTGQRRGQMLRIAESDLADYLAAVNA